ncbi:hypothetical protein HPB47_022243 [Ixodes persulcatus]|uniref:Uncharacterized protein n=1 Tax=Ixodes persulcatus TaxID=34615 RepID=A0AC60QA99_IXOPE|nr:hypothetical protein HPB47_022243 [Ixodes persulcatus]
MLTGLFERLAVVEARDHCAGNTGVVTTTRSASLGSKWLSKCVVRLAVEFNYSPALAAKILKNLCVTTHLCYAHANVTRRIKEVSKLQDKLADCFRAYMLFLSVAQPGTTTNPYGSRKWREFRDLAIGTPCFNTKEGLATQEPIHTLGQVSLPESIRRVLDRGPKYAVEPRKSRAELLSLVRGVARKVPETESERCVSEGVDVLIKRSPDLRVCPKLKVAHIHPSQKDKIRVKLATQVFSGSMAGGLNYNQEQGISELVDCEEFIHFIMHLNNLFDALNRR